ncbi:MAG: hydroxymethylbilane synthase, partial [Chloroflexi bacterium]|nr:hydroxymethylbilane synthase [Chloroflexota bacterium]
MDKTRKLVIGSRGSKLAVLQAGMVHDALRKAFPGAGFDFRAIATTGDRDRTRSLDEVGGQGIFVKELEYALSAGEIDFAVHSLKDVPTQLDPGMALAAVLPREDPRDVLVSCSGMDLAHLPAGARIGTDSRRRAAQLKAVRPDLVACPMRGNIDTRLRKVKMGRVDGAILAAAGLLRLGLAGHVVQFLEVQQFLPAVGQGAVAIELRAGDGRAASMASAINHASTMHAV